GHIVRNLAVVPGSDHPHEDAAATRRRRRGDRLNRRDRIDRLLNDISNSGPSPPLPDPPILWLQSVPLAPEFSLRNNDRSWESGLEWEDQMRTVGNEPLSRQHL